MNEDWFQTPWRARTLFHGAVGYSCLQHDWWVWLWMPALEVTCAGHLGMWPLIDVGIKIPGWHWVEFRLGGGWR